MRLIIAQLLLLLVGSSVSVYAQSTCVITGTLRNMDRSVAPNVTVTLTKAAPQSGTGELFTIGRLAVTTNASGVFSMSVPCNSIVTLQAPVFGMTQGVSVAVGASGGDISSLVYVPVPNTVPVVIGGGGGGAVSSVFGRTGAVVAATNDYLWSQIDKATSSLADITTRSASDLSSGTLPLARLSGITNTEIAAGAGIVLSKLAITGTPTGSKFLRDDATWQTIPGGGDALTANPLSQFAATTSAQLRGVLSDETGTAAAVFADSPVLVTPNLGTPSAAVLTNATGLPIATGVSGLGMGVATFLATPSSANLAAAVTDETGSGVAVFGTSPTIAGGSITGLTAFGIRSTGTGAFDLTIANAENLTAGRTLTIATGDAARTLTLGGNATLNGGTHSGTNTGDQTTVSGNAGTATALQTARTIGGVSFDGTANITVASATGGFAVTTELTTPSTIFAIANTTATTVNAFGAATTLNIGTSATVLNFGGGATAAEFRFLEPSGSGTNYSTFKAVAQSANITYSLPATVGAAGSVLTDAAGNGILSWAAGGGGSPGGSDTQLQRNNAGAFGGISGATSDGTDVTFGSANLRATSPRITTGIADANGNEILSFTATSSAVNEITLANAATGANPKLSATGGDTNIGLSFLTKGGGRYDFAFPAFNGAMADMAYFYNPGSGYNTGAEIRFGYGNSLTATSGIGGFYDSSNQMAVALAAGTSSNILIGLADGKIGINKSSSISAQLHVVSGSASRSVAVFDTAASPSVPVAQFRINAGANTGVTISEKSSVDIYNGTAPTASVTDGVRLYSEDVASSAELKVRDEAGNISTLSPHNFSLIPGGRSEEMAWSFYSERNGQYITVDMARVVRLLEKLTGEKLIFVGKVPPKEGR